MSDTRTPQEPGEELKRLVAEICDEAYNLGSESNTAWRSVRLPEIKAEGAQKIENYIQSRIPEVSEEAREFARKIESLTCGYYAQRLEVEQAISELTHYIAARDKAREEKWREVLEKYLEANTGSFSTTIDGREQRFEYEAKARALLSEKS